MPNPWMSFWLSAANAWAGAVAEMHRQQTAMANQMIRQTMDFWTKTWMVPIADHKPKRRR